MPPLYQVLHFLSARQGHLAEVRRLDQPHGAPKGQVFQWLWIETDRVTTLQFLAMENTGCHKRSFSEGALWFDDSEGELLWAGGATVQLTVRKERDLPDDLARLVNLHLT